MTPENEGRWKCIGVIHVNGEPKGQPRVKAFYNKQIGKARVYTPGTAERWKMDIAIAAHDFLKSNNALLPITGPVSVDSTFLFQRPQRLMRKRDPCGIVLHTSKPDRDNLDKAVLDTLSSLGIWTDDAQACSGLIEKYYVEKGGIPGASISISILKEGWL